MLILVVDDDPGLRLLSRAVLKAAGHDVLLAVNGLEAIDVARQSHPELVLLDVMMPELDGFGALDAMKHDEHLADIPVVMVSARVGIEDRLRAVEMGAIDYVSKPFQPDALADFIENVVRLGESELRRHRETVLASLRDSARGATATGKQSHVDLEAALNVVVDAVISLDDEGKVVNLNRSAEEVFGYLDSEVAGESAALLLPQLEQPSDARALALSGSDLRSLPRDASQPAHLVGRKRDGEAIDLEACAIDLHGSPGASMAVVVRDTSETLASEELQNHARQQAAIADLGQRALEGIESETLMKHTVRLAADVLGAEIACILERGEGDDLRFRAAIGWQLDQLMHETVMSARETIAGLSMERREPVLLDDLGADERFPRSDNLRRAGVRSAACVPLIGASSVYGALEVCSKSAGKFLPGDVHFLKALGNVLAAAMDREQVYEGMKALFEALPDATIVFDAEGRIESVNAATETLFGYSRDEMERMRVDQLVALDGSGRPTKDFGRNEKRNRSRSMENGESRGLRKDGEEIAIDVMLNPLAIRQSALTVATVRDVTERRKMEAMRDAFLHALSHELRTPLTAVVGFADLLNRPDVLKGVRDEIGEYAHLINTNARRLERLLSDLLDLDRLARGVLEPRRSPTDVGRLLRRVLDGLPIQDAPVTVEVEDGLDGAWLDAAKVERIIENLVINAVKHTPSGTPIHLCVRRHEGNVVIMVEDEGPGIPVEIREEIFEPFRRGNTTPHAPGTGIGLSLVARFAELHGGRAWVEQRNGGGSSFRVVLSESN